MSGCQEKEAVGCQRREGQGREKEQRAKGKKAERFELPLFEWLSAKLRIGSVERDQSGGRIPNRDRTPHIGESRGFVESSSAAPDEDNTFKINLKSGTHDTKGTQRGINHNR